MINITRLHSFYNMPRTQFNAHSRKPIIYTLKSIYRCLLPIANRPLLFYQFDLLQCSSATQVLVVTPHDYLAALSKAIGNYGSEKGPDSTLSIDIVVADEMMGSADGLRAVADRIRGDFICMCADVISQFSLGELVRRHKIHASDITMILAALPSEEPDKKGGVKKVKVDEEDLEFNGVCTDGRVVIKTQATEVDSESIKLSKPLLHRFNSLKLRSDLMDMGVYVMSRWILEFLTFNKKISSIRMDLVPYLVKRQCQSSQYLMQTFPSLMHRKRPLQTIENWLTNKNGLNSSALDVSNGKVDNLMSNLTLDSPQTSSSTISPSFSQHSSYFSSPKLSPNSSVGLATTTGATGGGTFHSTSTTQPTTRIKYQGLADYLANELYLDGSNSVYPSSSASPLSPSASAAGNASGGGLGNSGSSRGGGLLGSTSLASNISLASSNASCGHSNFSANDGEGEPRDLLRCYALIYESNGRFQDDGSPTSSHSPSSSSAATPSPSPACILQRVTNIQSYVNLNRDVPLHAHDPKNTPWPRISGFQKKEQSVVGTGCDLADKVTIKQCNVGNNCVIGAKSKLNSCIIMEGAVIGEGCVIQNSVVCSGVVIESNCNINECFIGSGAKVTSGTKVKGESITQ